MRRNIKNLSILFVIAAASLVSKGAAQQRTDEAARQLAAKNGYADLIVVNGKLVSMDDATPAPNPGRIYEALAVKGERILALGTSEWIRKLAGPDTKVIDVKGRTVIPALIESHSHIYGNALSEFGRDLGIKIPENGENIGAVTVTPDQTPESAKQVILSKVQEAANRLKPGEWIVISARGGAPHNGPNEWSSEPWSGKLPVRADLDKAAPNNPVLLQTGVRSFINSRTVQVAESFFPGYEEFLGYTGRKDAAKYGWIVVPEISALTWEIWMRNVPLSTVAEMFRRGMEKWPSFGVSVVATRIPHPSIMSGYNYLHRTGKMPVRFGMWFETQRTPTYPKEAMTLYKRTGSFWPLGDNDLWVMGMASEYWDSVGPEVCLGPDLEAPRHIKERETCPDSRTVFWNVYQNAIESGWRAGGAHGVGSDGARRFITMLEAAMKNKNLSVEYIRSLRPTLEHCTMLGTKPDVVEKLRNYNFILSCGPRFLGEAPRLVADYGPPAEAFILPLKSLIQAGVKIVGQIDGTPTQEGSFFHMWLAITRKITGKVWQPQERLDRVLALKMWTRWAAEYVYKDKDLGSLEAGKLADFTVLDKDYFTIPEDEIMKIRPSMTAIGGELRYVDGRVASEFGLRPAGIQMPPEFPYTERAAGGGFGF